MDPALLNPKQLSSSSLFSSSLLKRRYACINVVFYMVIGDKIVNRYNTRQWCTGTRYTANNNELLGMCIITSKIKNVRLKR